MSTATLDELKRALGERVRLENAFKQNVIDRITVILQGLRDCPAPPPGSPAAAALDLTRTQLDAFINELTHPTNLTDAEAQRIANTVNRDDLRRVGGPTKALPTRAPTGPGPAAPGPAGPSWWPFGRAAPAPLGAPRAAPLPRGSIYEDDLDDDPRNPSWLRDPNDPRVSSSRGSSSQPFDSRYPWLDPTYGRVSRGGWKSPRKRKPRGTKKYHSKV